uniref:C-type lectin domain-containing protein n=1 Tax=Syphacia muris TaxID=451379 RepID=A0A0N5AD09_9BILA
MSLSLFAIVLTIPLLLVSGGCPPGWEQYDTPDKCIAAFKEEMSWMAAYQYCISQRANLVSVHTAFQNFHIAIHITTNTLLFYKQSKITALAQQTAAACRYWIGLADIEGINNYTWYDGSTLDFQNWDKNQPPADSASTVVYFSLEAKNRWAATNFGAENNCFICEGSLNANLSANYSKRFSRMADPTFVFKKKPTICDSAKAKEKCGESAGLGFCLPSVKYHHQCYCHATKSLNPEGCK